MKNTEVVRVYHFCSAKYGLDNLVNKRLKIANILELNDPFELIFCDMTDKIKRDAVRSLKESFSREFGFLCFSRSYKSPVQWAHYGEKHSGICLGFDIPADRLQKVIYVKERKGFHQGMFETQRHVLEWLQEFITTKHRSWSYEREMRMICNLSRFPRVGGLFFASFSEAIQLKQVIVGCNSKVTGADVRAALGEEFTGVDIFKARPAFSKFEIVRNKSVIM